MVFLPNQLGGCFKEDTNYIETVGRPHLQVCLVLEEALTELRKQSSMAINRILLTEWTCL
ncbi:hypothetical protein Mucpa_2181 [Mucilaginibacter paludis DSM 18603]|uniref:Uncharacterized protein n=1 Tax=Mucilaginibacter paludis DSM 18603 TaxID=714943 RepID=H1YG31_9SPHI|nr:hypothetical protein Mucpa_2181 [Mucilaginibacter paludis DSM 18603]